MATEITIARPYARAVFGIALDAAQLSEWAAFLMPLAEVVVTLKSSLQDPRVGELKIAQWLNDELKTFPQAQRYFIAVLAAKKRLLLVPMITTLFLQLKDAHEKLLTADIISAYPLSAAEMELFSSRLTKRYGQQVKLENHIDPSVMGGAKIRMGDSVFDGSVKTQLLKLHQALRI